MRTILKARWLVLLVWIAAAVGLFLTAPPMSELVREKGGFSVPDGYSSTEAAALLDEIAAQDGGKEGSTVALVFHDPAGLTAEEKEQAKQAVAALEKNKESLHINSILSPFDRAELEDRMISENGQTILVSLSVEMAEGEVSETQSALESTLEPYRVDHYLTGEALISEDTVRSSEEGLKKSEYITVVFILLILVLVFRSLIAPFVPLLTVGLSYIVSQSIVAFLVDRFDFPLSNFTQIFMVAVMFGIGTDYCILLISRYKEEMGRTDNKWDAIVETYRTAGRTVLVSGLAVLVGFAAIGLSQFMLYRSAVAVAVGIAVMLLAMITIVPFFMAVLGQKMFWPSRKAAGHSENRLWGWAGSFSFKRPWASLLIVLAVSLPLLLTYSGKLSFNSLEEVPATYESIQGFNIISDSFGAGEAMPSKIVIKGDEPMDNAEYIAIAERISREVSKVDGVDSVRSVSRPTGEEISDFSVASQAGTLGEGLGEAGDGLKKIEDGLGEAGKQLSDNAPQIEEAASGADELVTGTEALKTGVEQLGDGLTQIEDGIRSGATGAGDLQAGLARMKASAQQLADAHAQLLASYQQVGTGLNALNGGMSQLGEQLNAVSGALTGVQGRFGSLERKFPELLQDQDYLTIRGTVTQTGQGAAALADAFGQIQGQVSQIASGIGQANAGYAQAADGQSQLAAGFDQLIAGIEQLQSGLNQAADGQGQIVDQVPSITDGLDQLQGGQEQIGQGFRDLSGQLTQLTDGLTQSTDGLKQVGDGLGSAQDYLKQLEQNSDSELGGWYIPQEALDDEQFQEVYDNYMSKDRKIMTMDVVLSQNPYSTQALDKIPGVQAAVERGVKGTALENADVAISGVTSTFADLQTVSNADYSRTVYLMLGGILIILILLLRSIVMPLYLVISLFVTYYVSLGATEAIFVHGLGYSGITWTTPFFGFVMLIALGVDYSIFLMDRFNEHRELGPKEAILHAMRNMGTVILSAVLILSGTFASMIPSGVLSMMQIATVVLVGLVVYALLMLPFFVPVMVKTFGRANWWPFRMKEGFDEGAE
ncbi:MMPL family transporter [Saccharibacillus sp. CPCC 101409]|uniref:MMPL family transporter n=1 Tax=Saccharibacillus sp. CPCC 101409 TaxID=3058041 RepID=UPI002673C087|nr:MMPL family transporter [Saccharibacillus sp. CPCC 101409]MDO3410757.1 MMPL family transporter [Saccharibacillus sp. CPCC 101409]